MRDGNRDGEIITTISHRHDALVSLQAARIGRKTTMPPAREKG